MVGVEHGLTSMLQGAPIEANGHRLDSTLLAPVDRQEIWAAGVTYERSLDGRIEESSEPDIYERVYVADRPELFFKAPGERVVGPGAEGFIRSDSSWDVPEPEVALVLDAAGSIFGYTIADDISSRSIEGENPLYLPQAKIYHGSCVLGPWILPATDVTPPFDIVLRVRRGNRLVFEGETSTAKMTRNFEDLTRWLNAGMRFPEGVVLLTGTGIVPHSDATLEDGDEVEIEVDQLGTLTHRVRRWTS